MNRRIVIAGVLLLALPSAVAAQQVSGRIDLDVIARAPRIAGLPSARPAAVHIAFAESDVACPERHGTLQMSGGELRLHQFFTRSYWSASSLRPRNVKPIDDEAYQYEIATKDCRIQLDVRLQIRRDGAWTSLSLPWQSLPSIPPAEKRAALNRLLEQAREKAKSRPPANNRVIGPPPVKTMLGEELGGLNQGFFFENAPKPCIEGVGTFLLDRDGATFSFMAGLPGDINRFAIERADVDPYRGRLYFVQGDCRYEITVGMWFWYHFDWAPLRVY